MNTLDFVWKSDEIHLALFKGYKEENNRPFYAFIAIDGNEYDRLQNTTEPIILGDYGEVLFSDFGHDVPEWALIGVVSGFKKRLLREEHSGYRLN